MSIFEAYPYTVVSLDFIKSARRFFDFKRACPEMVVVDEAHAAVSGGRGRQRRYELVRSLADDRERHLILLTATPHSGNETAFHNLLGLIDTEFANLPDLDGQESLRLTGRFEPSHVSHQLHGHVDLLRCSYNFIRPHRALKFGRETRTPAMQAGLVNAPMNWSDIFTAPASIKWARNTRSACGKGPRRTRRSVRGS